jgi:hypothetical protein
MKPLNILGLAIFSAGVLALAGFGLYEFIGPFLIDAEIPLVVKIGIIGTASGVIIILTSLVLERARDKEKEENDYRNNR